jgi:hypothetical protein
MSTEHNLPPPTRKRHASEPTLLHEHEDLRLGTLFREHTVLGETFEYALSQVIEDDPTLINELRKQFGESIDAVCDEIELEDQKKSFNTCERNDTDNTKGVINKRRKIFYHNPVKIESFIEESSGTRGTFHYQTSTGTILKTPVHATEFKHILTKEESLEMEKGRSLKDIRGLIPATKETFSTLSKAEIDYKLSSEYNQTICNGEDGDRSESLAALIDVHNTRMLGVLKNGVEERVGKLDIWCARA